MRTAPLAAKLLLRDTRFSTALLTVGLTITGTMAALGILVGSVERAVMDGTEADYANYKSFVQVVNPTALGSVLRSKDLQPTWIAPATVSALERETPVSLRGSKGRLPLVTLGGRKPSAVGEVAVTPAVMAQLGIEQSSKVVVETSAGWRRELQVVGVVVDPRDRSVRTAIVFDQLDDQEPTAWLSDEDVFGDPAIAAALDRGTVRGRTIELLARDQVEHGVNPVVKAIRSALPTIVLALVILGAVLTSSLVATLRRHQESLQAAGMASLKARRVLLTTATAGLFIASVTAALTLSLVAWLAKSVFARLVNQYWLGLGLNWGQLVVLTVLAPIATVLIGTGLARLERIRARPFLIAAKAWVPLLVVGILLIVLPGLIRSNRELAVLGGLLVTVGGAGAATGLLLRTRQRVQRRVLAHFVGSASGPALLVGLMVFSLAAYLATTAKSLEIAEESSAALQPTGSLLVDGVNRQAAKEISAVYSRAGGQDQLVYELASDRPRPVRVTSARLAECYAQSQALDPGDLLEACGPPKTLVPINVIGFSEAVTSRDTVAVDPNLLSPGGIGFLYPPRQAGERWKVEILRTSAQPMKNLGGNLPAALLAPASPLAKRLDVVRGGGYGVVLLGLDRLPPRGQAEVRYAVSQLAGTAGVSETSGVDLSGERALLSLLAFAGSAVIAAVLWAIGQALDAAHSEIMRSLTAAGADRALRRRLHARLLGLPLALVLSGVATGPLVAHALVPPTQGSFGLLWLLPLLFAIPVLLLRSMPPDTRRSVRSWPARPGRASSSRFSGRPCRNRLRRR